MKSDNRHIEEMANLGCPIALEAINVNLLEALEQMSQWFDADGYATSVPPRTFVFAMREAIQKARES